MNYNFNQSMAFISSKYTNEELTKMGVMVRRRITCRAVDRDNPNFINYHLHDMFTDANIPLRERNERLYLIQGENSVLNPNSAEMEIIIFNSPNSRDRFIINNSESFKMENPKNKEERIYDPLVMTYFN